MVKAWNALRHMKVLFPMVKHDGQEDRESSDEIIFFDKPPTLNE